MLGTSVLARQEDLGPVWQECAHPALLEAPHEPTDVRDG